MRVFVLLLAAAGILAGCAARNAAPVSDQARGMREPASEQREVVAGDTLYSIAWEIGRDHRELAAWNGLKPPYTIYPGQKLRLQTPVGGTPAPGEEEVAAADEPSPPERTRATREHTVRRGDTLYGIARANRVSARELAAWNRLTAPYLLTPGQKLRLEAPAAPAAKKRTSVAAPAKPARTTTAARKSGAADPPASAPQSASVGNWAWPAQGPLLARFSSGSNSKGIDIGGQKGTPVLAALSGSVVYHGSGLRGYGQLIIVKHNAEFLSAYAHCDRIYVKEGDVVQRGQKIADMGSSGADRVKLHFEIRYRGTPVDPLKHLPRK